MTTYSTQNPLGSSDPRDLYDNAENLDSLVNGAQPSYGDRFGQARKSWAGMEDEFAAAQADRDAEFNADQDGRESQFSAFIASSGYEFVGDYAAGNELTGYQQILRDTSGEFWRLSGSVTLPYTTTGAGLPEGGNFVAVGDAALRQDLVQPVATFNNVADMGASGGLDVGRKVRTLGYYTPGDGGGNDYEIVAAGTGTDDGGSFIDLDNGLQAKGLFISNEYDSRQWGATGTGDESVKYNSAVKYILSVGCSYLRVELDHDTPLDIDNRSNVFFVGNGSFSGTNYDTGNYRRQVVPLSSPHSTSFPDSGMNLLINRPSGSPPIKIVITGDSLTTPDANALAPTDGVAAMIKQSILSANPDLDIDFIGRGVGGQKWVNLDTVPTGVNNLSTLYPWYHTPSRDWLDYIFDESPDYVVISMGINDDSDIDFAAFKSVLSKIETNGAKVLLVTNNVTNLSPHPDYAQEATYDKQEGCDFAAGYVRSYARYHGYPLIDVNRTFNLIRDGRDILDTYLIWSREVTYTTPNFFVANDEEACRDFSMDIEISVPAGDNPYQSPSPMVCQLGPVASCSLFIDDSNGNIRLRFFAGDGAPAYNTVVTNIPTPTQDHDIEISVKGCLLHFRVKTIGFDEPLTFKIIRMGGLFKPKFNFSGTTTGPVKSLTLHVGKERSFLPLITDNSLYGDNSISSLSPAVRNPLGGGNGINHPTSLGCSTLYGTHFNKQNYNFINLA